MIKNLFAPVLAFTLLVAPNTTTFGNDSTVGIGSARVGSSIQQDWRELPLPPIPHLETIPWLKRGSPAARTKVDLLWQPHVDTHAPVWLQPAISTARFSLNQSPAGQWTE
jgi:hypothetical protein